MVGGLKESGTEGECCRIPGKSWRDAIRWKVKNVEDGMARRGREASTQFNNGWVRYL